MATNQTGSQANPNPPPIIPKPPPMARPLAMATAIVFLISSAFHVTAGLSKNTASFPAWWGILDLTPPYFDPFTGSTPQPRPEKRWAPRPAYEQTQETSVPTSLSSV